MYSKQEEFDSTGTNGRLLLMHLKKKILIQNIINTFHENHFSVAVINVHVWDCIITIVMTFTDDIQIIVSSVIG